jgi:hypothetical protein
MGVTVAVPDPVWTKTRPIIVAALNQNALPAFLDDKLRQEVFLCWDIPGILNICADCEPSARWGVRGA